MSKTKEKSLTQEAIDAAEECLALAKYATGYTNGEDKDPPTEAQDNQLQEIPIPDDKAKSLGAAGDMLNKARFDAELAQSRYDALIWKTYAQCGANPDDYQMQLTDGKLKFVRVEKK